MHGEKFVDKMAKNIKDMTGEPRSKKVHHRMDKYYRDYSSHAKMTFTHFKNEAWNNHSISIIEHANRTFQTFQ